MILDVISGQVQPVGTDTSTFQLVISQILEVVLQPILSRAFQLGRNRDRAGKGERHKHRQQKRSGQSSTKIHLESSCQSGGEKRSLGNDGGKPVNRRLVKRPGEIRLPTSECQTGQSDSIVRPSSDSWLPGSPTSTVPP